MFGAVNLTTICVCMYFFVLLTNTHADVLQCYVCVDCDEVNATHIESCIQPDDPVTQPSTDSTSTVALTETQTPDQSEVVTPPTTNPETDVPDPDVTVTTSEAIFDIPTTETVDSKEESTSDESKSITISTEETSSSNLDAAVSNEEKELNDADLDYSNLRSKDYLTAKISAGLVQYMAKIETPSKNRPDVNTGSQVLDKSYYVLETDEPDFAQSSSELHINPEVSNVSDAKSKEIGSTYYKVEMMQNKNSDAHSRQRKAFLGTLREFSSTASETRCVVTSFIENDVTKVVRGCSFLPGNPEDRCRNLIGGDFTGNLTHCTVCEENLCNSAYKSGTILFIFMLTLFIKI